MTYLSTVLFFHTVWRNTHTETHSPRPWHILHFSPLALGLSGKNRQRRRSEVFSKHSHPEKTSPHLFPPGRFFFFLFTSTTWHVSCSVQRSGHTTASSFLKKILIKSRTVWAVDCHFLIPNCIAGQHTSTQFCFGSNPWICRGVT